MTLVSIKKDPKPKKEHSKKLIDDNRYLLWFVNISGMLLAFFCVYRNYDGALPWIVGAMSSAWAGHATICSFYMNKSKKENTVNGITYQAMMNEFEQKKNSWESPPI